MNLTASAAAAAAAVAVTATAAAAAAAVAGGTQRLLLLLLLLHLWNAHHRGRCLCCQGARLQLSKQVRQVDFQARRENCRQK